MIDELLERTNAECSTPPSSAGFAAYDHARRTVPLLLQRVVTVGVPVVISVLVSRYLGERDFGRFSVALVTVSGLQMVSEFGLDKFLPREFVEAEDQSTVFRDWLSFRLFLAIILYVVLVIGAVAVRTDRDITVVLAVYGLTLFSAGYSSTCRSYFISTAQTTIVGVAAVMAGLVSLLGAAAALYAGSRSLVTVSIPLAVSGVAEMVILAQGLPAPSWLRPRKVPITKQVASTWEFGWQTLASVLYTRIGIYALTLTGGAIAVATYTRASMIYSSLSLVPAAAAVAMYPALVRAVKQRDKIAFIKALKENLFHLGMILVPVAFTLGVFGGPLLRAIYGGGAVGAESVAALRILLLAFLAVLLNSALAFSLFAVHAQREVARRSVLSLGFCAIANAVLVPLWGVCGAAWATMLSEVVALFLFVPLLRSRIYNLTRNKAEDTVSLPILEQA